MAERITDATFGGLGAPPKYPWDKWADGGSWRITRGEDFDIPAVSMAAVIRSYAKRNGLFVGTRRTGDTIAFRFVRATANDGEEAA